MAYQIETISKDYWMPSSSVKNCFKCDKPFGWFRMKYHCNYCGYIFCSFCISKNVKVRDDLVLDRCCQSCSSSIQEKTEPVEVQSFILDEPHMSPEPKLTRKQEKLKTLHLKQNEPSASFWDVLSQEELYRRASQMLQGLPGQWVQIVTSLVTQAVQTVYPSVHYRNDSMDMNNYIKI